MWTSSSWCEGKGVKVFISLAGRGAGERELPGAGLHAVGTRGPGGCSCWSWCQGLNRPGGWQEGCRQPGGPGFVRIPFQRAAVP